MGGGDVLDGALQGFMTKAVRRSHLGSAGTFSTVVGAVSAGTCGPCAKGAYYTDSGAPAAATCALCAAGTFFETLGQNLDVLGAPTRPRALANPKKDLFGGYGVQDNTGGRFKAAVVL